MECIGMLQRDTAKALQAKWTGKAIIELAGIV